MPDLIFAPLGTAAPSMLFAGDLSSYSTGIGLVAGFRALGWDVAEASMLEPTIRSTLKSLRIAARVLGPVSARSYNQQILDMAERTGARVMLTVKGIAIAPETIRTLAAARCADGQFLPRLQVRISRFRRDDVRRLRSRRHDQVFSGRLSPQAAR